MGLGESLYHKPSLAGSGNLRGPSGLGFGLPQYQDGRTVGISGA